MSKRRKTITPTDAAARAARKASREAALASGDRRSGVTFADRRAVARKRACRKGGYDV
jgi:ribosome assembly protein YihI (activator of Der GTPase)